MFAYLKNEDQKHGERVSQGRIYGRALLHWRYLGRPQQNSTIDETIQHTRYAQAQDDPNGNKNDFPAPRNKVVQFQRQEDKLQRIHGQEHLQLETAIVFHGPNTGAHAGQTAKDQGDKDEHPEMISRAQSITGQELKHEQDEMQRQADQHRLKLDIGVYFDAIMRIATPNEGSYNSSQCGYALPYPQRGKDAPYWPVYGDEKRR